MHKINCHIPIKLRITGQPSDTQLEKLSEDLVRALEARILFAEQTITPHTGRRMPTRDVEIVRDEYDFLHDDLTTNLYTIPSYEGNRRRTRVQVQRRQAPNQQELTSSRALVIFTNFSEVYDHILTFFPNPKPRGNLFFGVYGIWADRMIPYLFWVSGVIQEGVDKGQPLISSISIVKSGIHNGRLVPSGAGNEPLAVSLGEIYRFRILLEQETRGEVIYNARLRRQSGGSEISVSISGASYRRLRGKVIQFGVPSDIEYSVTIRAQAPARQTGSLATTRQPAPWNWYWGNRSLSALPEGGIPDWLWRWYGWLNVGPAKVRENPLVQAVFQDWEQRGEWKNVKLLTLGVHYKLFYREYCQKFALAMLTESRQRMNGFLTWLNQNEVQWKQRFATLVQALQEPAQQLDDIRRLATLKQDLAAQQQLLQQQTDYGLLPGGLIIPEEVEALRRRIERAEQAGPSEEQQLALLLQLVQEMEPLMVLLTVNRSSQNAPLEQALVWASGLDANTLFQYVLRKIRWLIGKNQEAEREIQKDRDVAATLQIVQEKANEQLAAYLQFNPSFQRAIEELLNPSVIIWIGLGLGLLIITFIFPPLGIGLGAAVGVGLAVGSVRRALQLSRLRGARLAQYGFRPLVSEAEISAAMLQAAIDVFFVALDIGVITAAASRSLRGFSLANRLNQSAAREAAGALGQSIERALLGWQRLDLWPDGLKQLLRRRIIGQLDQANTGWRTGLTIEQITQRINEMMETVQRELVFRYEVRLLGLQRRFERAVMQPGGIGDIQAWLLREFPDAQEYFTKLISGELRPGELLFENTIARRLAGLSPQQPPQLVRFLSEVTSQELQAITRELGTMAELLTANRLFALGRSAGMDYPTLARTLNKILRRVNDSEQVLTKLENLIVGRRDAGTFLNALEGVANPRSVLETLTPQMLNVRLPGGFHELFHAISRPSRHGEVVRIISDLNAQGSQTLFREVRRTNRRSFFQRWSGLADRGWVYESGIRVPPSTAVTRIAVVTVERTAALTRLESRAAATTARGRPTAAAGRIRSTLGEIEAHSASREILEEIANVAVREGDDVASGILERLNLLASGSQASVLEAVADFLRRGGEGRALNAVLGSMQRTSRSLRSIRQVQIHRLLGMLSSFQSGELRGISVVLATRGYGRRGAEAVLAIIDNFRQPRAVFGALNDLAPHSDGLGRLIGYLSSHAQNLNQAAVGQLFAARRLLEEFPGRRIVFEVPVWRGSVLIREIDIQVVTPFTRVPLLEVELKEITHLFSLGSGHVRQQFARDIVRSVQAARAGEAPLGRIRWLIRERELIHQFGSRDAVRREIRDRLREVFDIPHPELNQLSLVQRQAARRDFMENLERILQLF